MKILILTPLFPPDTGDPASYVKDLAARLSLRHSVTVLLYGHLPEAVPGTTLRAIDKRASLFQRLFVFTYALLREARNADLVLINNGPSTELPFLLVSAFIRTKTILLESDPLATVAAAKGSYRRLHTYLKTRVTSVFPFQNHMTYRAAEWLPFGTRDEAHEQTREQWWANHIQTILQV